VQAKILFGTLFTAGLLAACADGSPDVTAPTTVGSQGRTPELSAFDEPGVRARFQVVTGTGDISGTVAQFRALLGDPNNGGTPDDQKAGRREIKWDGVPLLQTNNDAFPADFFNTTVKAGLLYSTPGTGFRVSDNDFSDINLTYQDQFNSFSPFKTFMSVGSPEMDLSFRVAGSNTPAVITGFGVVFSDVDRVGSASIKLFTIDGKSLGQYLAPVRSDINGHSFVGVVFDQPIVGRVVLTSGQAALGADVFDLDDGGNKDLVVTDDFLYGEPHAAP
jgi:hypothetical protein